MTVYLDMDGVIADFFGALAYRNGVSHWKSIKDIEKALVDVWHTDFFYQIDEFPESEKIVEMVKKESNGDWGICSSPLRGDMMNSAYWKREWLAERHWLPEIEKLIFTGNKHKYAVNRLSGKPNILIDDKPDNIKRWNDAGGIGIRFQCDQDDWEFLHAELRSALKC